MAEQTIEQAKAERTKLEIAIEALTFFAAMESYASYPHGPDVMKQGWRKANEALTAIENAPAEEGWRSLDSIPVREDVPFVVLTDDAEPKRMVVRWRRGRLATIPGDWTVPKLKGWMALVDPPKENADAAR